jgi:inhibitor of KinA sporulation pathway (predicted exonuclease)
MEIIEIGAVRLAAPEGPPVDEFTAFVRPVCEPALSDFCTELTSIRQEDVDGAEPFPAVFDRFLHWIGGEEYRLCSWGGYDLGQFRLDCARHGLPLPAGFEAHVNLKQGFSRRYGCRPLGMSAALAKAGLSLEGRHHRGIDDARNIAKLARLLLGS